MTLRRRLTLLSAVAVAIAVTLAAGIAYVATRDALLHDVDTTLDGQSRFLGERVLFSPVEPRRDVPAPPPRRGGPIAYGQLVTTDGVVHPLADAGLRLPAGPAVQAIARAGTGRVFSDAWVNGTHLRVLTVGEPQGAIQLARSLDGVDRVLRGLRLVLIAVCLAGIGLAALLGRMLGRRVVAPIRAVAATAHHISETEDLARRIEPVRRDEVGELAAEFNAMLDTLQASQDSLDRSVHAQRRLVADASHELRTPVTALRANVELLEDADPRLGPDERRRLLAEVRMQSEELGGLVADIVELARGAEAVPRAVQDVRLDELVQPCVARSRLHARGVEFMLTATPVSVDGEPERLARAINNLLDNAAEHGGGGLIEVRVDAGGVVVRDHGPGIPSADLAHVFDRFYRSAASRGRPGTGLGLAIVKQVAETHLGSVEAANATGGGAVLRLRLPGRPVVVPRRASSVDVPGGAWRTSTAAG
jgi:two-component system, OmpR family, sensor histidine kinase MprB